MSVDEDQKFQVAVDKLNSSAERAREQWVLAAQAYRQMRARTDWPVVKPLAELTVYLTSLDYELKVLIYRHHSDVENRAVWERFLALEVYEAVEAVPKRLGAILRRADARSSEFRNYKEVNSIFSATVKAIREDQPVWDLIKRMRNEVTAHHGSKGDDPMLAHVAWALASEEHLSKGLQSHRSKVSEYAVRIGSTVQQIGVLVSANS